MEITTRLEGEEMHIALRGRLDAAWSGTVHQSLQDTIHGGCHRIALDLSQVNYMSSAGIRILVMLAQKLSAIGGQLRLTDVSAQVSEVLNLVGFHQLLKPLVNTPPANRQAALSDAAARAWYNDGFEFEVYDLQPEAIQTGQVIDKRTGIPISIPIKPDRWVIGQGALGPATENDERAGELIAVEGLAITLPGNDPSHPDWMLRQGDLVPEIGLVHGLLGDGPFRHLLRFGMAPGAPPLDLSRLLRAALELCNGPCVALVVLAETVQLIGAALQVPLRQAETDFFAFPALRDRLLFTAEPAFAGETCLIVGVAARHPEQPLARQLRPLDKDSELTVHLHAAIVPFNPIRKGRIELRDSLDRFIDTQTVRGLLHLLNDDRDGVGAGESVLHRGALWCAPVEFNPEPRQ